MTPRELRLRQRIDTLLDERAELRAQVETLRARLKRRANRLFEVRRSRDLWRTRATRR